MVKTVEYLHLWRTIENDQPMRVDCGAMIGWWPFFKPYLELKVAALNHASESYYIGNAKGEPISVD
jgi:hypothetical protein